MKKQIILIALSIVVMQSCKKDKDIEPQNTRSIGCLPGNLSNGVLAYYSFGNGSLNDLSGNNNNLINTTTAHSAPDRDGNAHCAFEFNHLSGANEFLTTSNTSFLNGLTEFSVSLWYQPLDTTRNGANFESLLQRNTKPGSYGGEWYIGLHDCRKAVFGEFSVVWDRNITNDTTNFSCEKEVKARTGSWHHLVAVCNKTNPAMKLYRDGVLQDTDNTVYYSVHDIGDLFLGKDYTGRLDDVIIYNKLLNQAEVTQLKSLSTCCSN